jgi:hypothetical protein
MGNDCCGTCRFHSVDFRNNGNGECTNPESPRHKVVTGQQGLCAGYELRPPPMVDAGGHPLPQAMP